MSNGGQLLDVGIAHGSQYPCQAPQPAVAKKAKEVKTVVVKAQLAMIITKEVEAQAFDITCGMHAYQ